MNIARSAAWGVGGIGAVLGATLASYAAYAGATWLRYGDSPPPVQGEADELLDQFMPRYEIAERHYINVAAPADVTFAASMDMDLQDSAVIRAIFKGRQIVLGADAEKQTQTRGLVAVTKELGWEVLAEVPGREIVMGAVTQPWKADVVFRGLSPDEFARFDERDYVKIVWTLRADAVTPRESIARTETRVLASDAEARRKFRWYWSRFSAGIVLIRQISLRLIKKEAERRAAELQRGNGSSTKMVVPPVRGTSM